MLSKLLRHTRFWQGLVLLVADVAFFSTTNPGRVVSIVLMLGFLLLAFSLYYLVGLMLVAARLYGVSFGRHRQRLALFLAGAIAAMLALQSIGEFSLRDALVLGPLALVLYVYLGYGRLKTET